jgi:hypothetical protein
MAKSGQRHASRRRSVQLARTGERTASEWWRELLWVPAAAGVGFGVTAVLAGWLEVSRSWLVLGYAGVVVPMFVGYVRWSRIDLTRLVRRRWPGGVVGAAVVGAFLVANVLGQDAAPRPDGARLVWDVIWLGVVYGLVDAILLTVFPVTATWRAFSRLGWTKDWAGRIAVGAIAVAASLAVTAAYHLGYPEFRGPELRDPLIGNVIVSVGYVLTTNPITAVVSHIAMHIAAVLHGAEGAVQLPPHY